MEVGWGTRSMALVFKFKVRNGRKTKWNFFFSPPSYSSCILRGRIAKRVLIQPTIVIEVWGFCIKNRLIVLFLLLLFLLCDPPKNFTASLKREKYQDETWLLHFAALERFSRLSTNPPFLYISLQSADFRHMLGSTGGRTRATLQYASLWAAESYSWALIWKQLWGKRRRRTSNKQARRWCSSFYKIITAVRHQASCQTASLMRRSTCWAGCNPDGCAIPGFHCERLSSANSLDTAQPPEGHTGRRSTLLTEDAWKEEFFVLIIKVYLFFGCWFSPCGAHTFINSSRRWRCSYLIFWRLVLFNGCYYDPAGFNKIKMHLLLLQTSACMGKKKVTGTRLSSSLYAKVTLRAGLNKD